MKRFNHLSEASADTTHPLTSKDWLYEISFMRPILLLLLVSYHAFAPWCGGWDMPEGCFAFEPYRWVALLSRAFRLECFVFISGYIFTFQILSKNKFPSFKELLNAKIVRLLIPCWVFSLIYFVLFKDYTGIVDLLITIFEGAGHLWYLPCLFICFLLQWVLIKRRFNRVFVLVVLSLLVFVSFVPIPLKMNNPLYYMVFFYGGGLFYQEKTIIARKSNRRSAIISWVVFICFLFVTRVSGTLSNNVDTDLFERGLIYGSNRVLKASLAWIGIYAFYISAVVWCRNHIVSEMVLKIGACGYGVYVFHQFLLVWLYDYTQLPQLLGTYWLPWISFFVATVVSLILTLFIREFKVGRKYL